MSVPVVSPRRPTPTSGSSHWPTTTRAGAGHLAMARVYDARKLYVAARDAYLDLLARFPKVRLESGKGPTVAERRRQKLRRPAV